VPTAFAYRNARRTHGDPSEESPADGQDRSGGNRALFAADQARWAGVTAAGVMMREPGLRPRLGIGQSVTAERSREGAIQDSLVAAFGLCWAQVREHVASRPGVQIGDTAVPAFRAIRLKQKFFS
jgi:hypothetical protein